MPYPMKNTKKTAWQRITETVELKSKTWALGLVIAVLSSTGFAQNKVSHLTRDWLDFSDQTLGVQLKYPRHWKVWTQGDDIYLDKRSSVQKKKTKYAQIDSADRAFNGRIHSNDGLYLLHLSTGTGDFVRANIRYYVFEGLGKDLRLAYGRFNNESAEKIQTQQWSGYASPAICSTEDAGGFHAAGGMCYWSLISDGHKYVLTDSQPLETDQDARNVHLIVMSINFLKPKK
ncbi:hypothetical protein B9Z52_11365 [Limnohabitans sp. Jir72]|nr:hypothetical protein B9Z52_11365 [Limnohabitans sp. Jir72]